MKSPIYYFRSVAQKAVIFINRGKESVGSVFMFHDVYAEGKSPVEAEIAIRSDRFRDLIDGLNKEWRIVSLDKLMESNDPKLCALTFDDIFSSACQNALPYLREKNIPYTCFVASGLIDKKPFLCTKEFQEIINDPLCTLGAHTDNHVNLRALDRAHAYREIEQGKLKLEALCGKDVNIMAYPYGSKNAVSKQNVKMAGNVGFRNAFSTYAMHMNPDYVKKNPHFIPRINVNDGNWEDILK